MWAYMCKCQHVVHNEHFEMQWNTVGPSCITWNQLEQWKQTWRTYESQSNTYAPTIVRLMGYHCVLCVLSESIVVWHPNGWRMGRSQHHQLPSEICPRVFDHFVSIFQESRVHLKSIYFQCSRIFRLSVFQDFQCVYPGNSPKWWSFNWSTTKHSISPCFVNKQNSFDWFASIHSVHLAAFIFASLHL